jgi:hypothetical protein
MNDVRSESRPNRPLEAAAQGRDRSRPTASLRPPAATLGPILSPTAAQLTLADHSPRRGAACCARLSVPDQPHSFRISTRFCPKSRSHTKHRIKPSLPGSRFAHSHAQTSLAKSLSNRELHLLEPTLTHRKQTIAPRSNRELSTNPCFRSSVSRPFLTGSASQTESSVTHSKQSTTPFLTGARTHIKDFDYSPDSAAQPAPAPWRQLAVIEKQDAGLKAPALHLNLRQLPTAGGK